MVFKREKQPIEEIEDEKDEIPTPEPVDKKSVEEKKPNKVLVVRDLPTQSMRQVKGEDETIMDLITIEEALTELLNR